MATSRVDSSDRSHLPTCSCGWRGRVWADRSSADTERADHESSCHPGDTAAAQAVWGKARRRRVV